MPMSNLLRQLRGRPQLVTIDIAGLPRFRMETHGRSDLCISAAIEDWGHWEPSSTAIVRQLLQGRADFIDIGANIGWYTLVAAHALGANGHVHSFEPDASHVAKLKANVLVNRLGNVSVNDVALSDRAGRATLHRDPRNRGDNSLLPSATRTGSASIALARLDDYPGLGVRPSSSRSTRRAAKSMCWAARGACSRPTRTRSLSSAKSRLRHSRPAVGRPASSPRCWMHWALPRRS